MSGTFTVNIEGLLPLKQQFALIAMPKALRRRLLSRTAKKVISDSKRRARNQIDINGKPFIERKKKRSRNRKMLTRLARRLKVLRNDALEAQIGWPRAVDSMIASKQHHGSTERVSARRFSQQTKPAFYNKPATRKQARALREAGFMIKKTNGKGKKSPSLKWIQSNMTVAKAGFALRQLRAWAGIPAKTSWQTKLPARPFLGASKQEVINHVQEIMKKMTQEITYVAR